MATRAFISFDYDHDYELKRLLVNQSHWLDSPFTIIDWSIKKASSAWKEEARTRIRRSNLVIVICGHHTDTATGVAEELRIAREEGVPYFLLWGRNDDGACKKPTTALWSDEIYKWTWENLKKLVGGER